MYWSLLVLFSVSSLFWLVGSTIFCRISASGCGLAGGFWLGGLWVCCRLCWFVRAPCLFLVAVMLLNCSLDAFGFSPAGWLALICFALLVSASACGLYVWSMVSASSSLVEAGNFCLFASFGGPGCSGFASL